MRTLLATTALVLSLALASQAGAYALTCGTSGDLLLNGTQAQKAGQVGYAIGTIDFIAGLMCYVGNPQCNCLQGAARNTRFAELVADELAECYVFQPNDPAWAPASRAARRLCPF